MRRILPIFSLLFATTLLSARSAVAEHVIAFEFGTLGGGSGVYQSIAASARAFVVGAAGDESYVTLRDAKTGAELANLTIDPAANQVGYSVALSTRGLAIGGPHAIGDLQGAVF